MKYGLILHNYGEHSIQAAGFNIGDPIQTLALEKLYKEMGISNSEIKYIELCDIKTYDGEYVILPMLGVALGVGFAPLPLSPKIIPVFISAHFVKNDLTDEEVLYLKQYEPIGCRDEYSLNTMRKYGILSFLTGCITTIFENRELIKGNSIFLIDTPESLNPFLPKEIRENGIYDTHLLPIKEKCMSTNSAKEYLGISKKRLEYYKNNASLVISSRMHALVPCMAMGIPVIAVFDNLSYRFSWLDKYIPLYTEENFENIDWNPKVLDFNSEKQKIKNVFKLVIEEVYNKFHGLTEISEFYEDRTRSLYGNKYYYALQKIPFSKEPFNYIIWGCGLIGNTVYNMMNVLYPNAQMVVAVDEYVHGTWHGVPIITSKSLHKYENCFIILATHSGKEQGYKIMNELDKKEDTDFIYVGTING